MHFIVLFGLSMLKNLQMSLVNPSFSNLLYPYILDRRSDQLGLGLCAVMDLHEEILGFTASFLRVSEPHFVE